MDDRRRGNKSFEEKESSDTSDSELSLTEEPLIEKQVIDLYMIVPYA